MNVLTNKSLSRRVFLRGMGVSLGLPLLEAMNPSRASAAKTVAPKRAAFFYIPNGVVQDAWHPAETGRGYAMSKSLTSLEKFREQLNVFTGLDREFRGGTGVHAQAACAWLTSSPPSEALDGGFPTNITVDQLIARKIGQQTLLPSLELSTNDHQNARETKHFETVSWLAPGYAAAPEKNPREVFQWLFGKPNSRDRAILDLVLDDAKRLRGRLGKEDQGKLDEYMESVHSVEGRITRAEKAAASRQAPTLKQPEGIPEDRREYLRLMGDLVVLAFQQDVTRVATMLIDPERWDTPRMYHGVFEKPQNHHVLTHTKGDEAKHKLQRIDQFHVEQFAYVLEKMRSIREGDGTLLDNSVITLGSGMGDGRVHNYNDVPIVMAGGLGGRLRTGEHRKYDGKKPLADLWLALLNAFDIKRDSFADSKGVLSDVLA